MTTSRAQAWFTVSVLTAGNVLAFLDRQVLSLLVVPIQDDLKISDTQISLLIGFAFALFYTLFGLPIGRWVDSGSRRLIVPLGIAVWSLATAACGLARSFGGLFTSRVFVGIGEASIGPAAYSMISDLFSVERRAKAIAVYTIGPALGSGIALAFAGLLIGYFDRHGGASLPLIGSLASWRAVFIVVGLPGLLLALLALAVREPERVGARAQQRFPLREVWRHVRSEWGLLWPLMVGAALMALSVRRLGVCDQAGWFAIAGAFI